MLPFRLLRPLQNPERLILGLFGFGAFPGVESLFKNYSRGAHPATGFGVAHVDFGVVFVSPAANQKSYSLRMVLLLRMVSGDHVSILRPRSAAVADK